MVSHIHVSVCFAELIVLYISHVLSSSTLCCAPAVFKAFCCAVLDTELCTILSYITCAVLELITCHNA